MRRLRNRSLLVVNEHFEHERNAEITLLDSFTKIINYQNYATAAEIRNVAATVKIAYNSGNAARIRVLPITS